VRLKRATGQVGPAGFLRDFSQRYELPIAEGEPLMAHDAAYHEGSIFIPDPAIAHARAQVKTYWTFREFIRLHYPEVFSDPTFVRIREQVERAYADQVDRGTGNFCYCMATRQPADRLFRWGFQELAAGGQSPNDLLNARLSQAWLDLYEQEGKSAYLEAQAKFKSAFVAASGEAARGPQPELRSSPDEFGRQVERRRREIKAAVLGSPPPNTPTKR
jgi:hypothetical protein